MSTFITSTAVLQSASDLGPVQHDLYAFRVARLSHVEEWRKEGETGREPGRRDAAPQLASKEVISARRHYSCRPVQPLFLDHESILGRAVRPRPVPPRACINHKTPGILSRQCETSVILADRAPLSFPPPRPILRALRSVMLLSSRLHSFLRA